MIPGPLLLLILPILPLLHLRQFTDRFPPSTLADDPDAASAFEPDLRALMETYEAAPPPDALKQAQTDLGNVKDIMVRPRSVLRLRWCL